MRNVRALFLSLCSLAMLAGCGMAPSDPIGVTATSTQLTAESVPPQSRFVTIQCTVYKLLPADTSGLPHQVFDVEETYPDNGTILEVDNDTHYGTKVPGLQVGDDLTIRGVEYHDWDKDGIHWTHHANQLGDAGYIETSDGTLYQ